MSIDDGQTVAGCGWTTALCRPRGAAAVLGVLALLGTLAFIAADHVGSPNGLVFPLDDAYIHLQYARQLAAGQFLQYNASAAPSTGATSLLFISVLAPFFWFSPAPETLVLAEFCLSTMLLWLAAWSAYGLVRVLAGELDLARRDTLALLAGILVVGNGTVLWLTFSGMEATLFLAAVMGALAAFAMRRHGLLAAALTVAVLTRPEGVALAALCAAVELCIWGWRRAIRACYVVPLALAGLQYLMNGLLTGQTAANGLVAKSWLYSVPFYPRGVAETILRWWSELLVIHLNGGASEGARYTPPLMLAVGLVALVTLCLRTRAGRASALVLAGWLLGGALMVSTLSTAFWHRGRYELPLVVVTLILGVLGGAVLAQGLLRRVGRMLGWGLAVAALIWSGWSAREAWLDYALAAHTFAGQQRVLATWIADHIPTGETVAVHDVGAIAYFGAHPTFDLIGLTGGSAEAYRQGPGATYEWLAALPASERPEYFASYEETPPVMAYLQQTSVLSERIFSVSLEPYSRFVSAHDTQTVYRADWRLVDTSDRPFQPEIVTETGALTLVDQLNVADLADEAAHDYRWWLRSEAPGFATEVHQFGYRVDPTWQVIDGGRVLNGGETLSIASRPGQDLLVVARVNARVAGAVRVSVDGRDVDVWRYPAVPGEWQEAAYWVPSSYITGERTLLCFEEIDGTTHEPYNYWFYQGEREDIPVATPVHSVQARFGDIAYLRGYDLAVEPGWVHLELTWEALSASATPLKVFVHLRDVEGRIVAQDDQEPNAGLEPTTLWARGQKVSDGHDIGLPADLAPGDYELWVGLYDPQTGQRVAAQGPGATGDAQFVTRIHLEGHDAAS